MVVTVTFAAIIVLIVGGLSWLNHRSMAHLAHNEALARFRDLSRQIRDEANDQLATAHIFLKTITDTATPDQPDIAAGELLLGLQRSLQQTAPAVLALLCGFPDGSLVMSQRITHHIAGAPAGAAYRILVTRPDPASGRFVRTGVYVDARGNVLGPTPREITDYDVRTRPWYQQAVKTSAPVTPPPYRFATTSEMGVTLAQQAEAAPGVVYGIDVLLSDLDDVLARMKTHARQELVLFTAAGELAAHPTGRRQRAGDAPTGPNGLPLMDQLGSPLLRAIHAAWRQSPTPGDRFVSVNGDPYVAHFDPAMSGTQLVTAIAMPQSAIMGPANDMARRSVALGLLALAIAMPAVYFASRSITRPLKALAATVRHIISFRGIPAPPPPSRIAEIHELSGAVTGLELAMKNFMRYVPRQIVRSIVAEGVQPTLGGVRQSATVVFTDIANFTGLAEKLDPEALMQILSRYFAAIGGALADSGATIDKFIGDGVMAFWNAPEPQPDHVARACHGVLDAAERLRRLNEAFRAEGLPELHTRFGVHTGEAVIGHVGSYDRINYTVLGHTVNVASRLEALNKEFGTSILVTEAVRDAAGGGFIFRRVGETSVRGASSRITVYELCGETRDATGNSEENREKRAEEPADAD